MSRIDELLAQFAPLGVPRKLLGDLVRNLDSQRRPVSRSDRSEGHYPYYGANGIQDYVEDYIFDGTFLLMGEDGSVMERDRSPILNWAIGKIWVNNHAHILETKSKELELRFLFHFLRTVDISSYVTGGTQLKLNQGSMNRIPVPVPPLEVQREIVRILDNFTELEARRRQFASYLERLLKVAGDSAVEQVALRDVAAFKRGTSITAKETASGDISVVANSPEAVYTHDRSNRTGETIVIARSGANAGLVSFWNIPIFLTDAFSVHPATDLFRPKFVYYWFKRQQDVLHALKKGAGVPHIRVSDIEVLQIPSCSLEVQDRVVEILDMLDALVNDLSGGLPAELAARRKQYEYYRDRLLTFEELPA